VRIQRAAVWHGTGVVFSALALVPLTVAALRLLQRPAADRRIVDTLYTWIGSGNFSVDVGLRFDALSCVVSFIAVGVGLFASFGAGSLPRESQRRLLVFAQAEIAGILLLVSADNLILAYFGWIVTGLGAVLWIGSQRMAGVRTLVVVGLADAAFLAGALLLFWGLAFDGPGSLAWTAIEEALASGIDGNGKLLAGAAYGLAIAVILRGTLLWLPVQPGLALSGQVLFVCCTGAAALIVAVRVAGLWLEVEGAALLLSWFAVLSALYAAAIGAAQQRIDRVLVCVGASHLGLTLVALGCGAAAAGVIHAASQAVFLSLLFLSGVALQNATNGDGSLASLGGVRSELPFLHRVFVIGALASVGFPFVLGFFSRESVLVAAYAADAVAGTPFYGLALGCVGVLAFTMVRIYLRVFAGDPPNAVGARQQSREVHGPWRVVLLFLATLCLVGGWFDGVLHRFLVPAVGEPASGVGAATRHWLAVSSTAVVGIGGVAAYLAHTLWSSGAPELVQRGAALFERRFGIDVVANRGMLQPLRAFCRDFLSRSVDRAVLEQTFLRGSADSLNGITDEFLKRLHTGQLQTYLLFLTLGAIAVVGYLLGAA
jgi:NADH-quinone oxidoreductase subunit L